MQLLSVCLPQHHRIILASDAHKGSLAHHRKGWGELIQRVLNEPDLYLALGGDLMEAILIDDKRFSYHVHDSKMVPLKILAEITEDLKPIAHKILFILTGNHELHLLKYGDLTEQLCTNLNVPYGQYSTKLTVKAKNGRIYYKLFYTHGRLRISSSADDPVRRLSNMKLTVKRRLQHLAGDCAIMATGHAHVLLHIDPEYELFLTDDGKEIQAHYTSGIQHGGYIDPNLRWYCSTGSFLKSYVTGAITYSEAAMYAPNQLGYIEIVVKNGNIKEIREVRISGHDQHHDDQEESNGEEAPSESSEG